MFQLLVLVRIVIKVVIKLHKILILVKYDKRNQLSSYGLIDIPHILAVIVFRYISMILLSGWRQSFKLRSIYRFNVSINQLNMSFFRFWSTPKCKTLRLIVCFGFTGQNWTILYLNCIYSYRFKYNWSAL